MSSSISRGSFKLATASGGVGLFALVEVEVSRGKAGSPPFQMSWMEDAFSWNDQVSQHGERERKALYRGVDIALRAFPEPVAEVRICRVMASFADTTDDCLTYATCFAVWDALQVCGCNPPRLENRKFHFPENP